MTTSARLSDRAYAALKREIVSLELAPGAVLSEPDLMERLGIGRTPLREALQRLAEEDLVVVLPHRGTFVSPVGAADVQAVFELRVELDALAARLAAERATPAQIDGLRSLMDGFAGEAAEFDREFHEAVAAAAHNAYLERTARRLYVLGMRMLNLLRIPRESAEEMRAEFSPIVEAIAARDANGADSAARRHVAARGWFPRPSEPSTQPRQTERK
jgi:DNA-binding GntR family transcriptional regulator